jgi:hypothetical protein
VIEGTWLLEHAFSLVRHVQHGLVSLCQSPELFIDFIIIRKGLTSPARASSASAQRLPDADPTPTSRVAKLETSRFPGGVRIDMPGSLTTPGCNGTRDSAQMHVAFHRIRMRRHPRLGFFRGSMAGLTRPVNASRCASRRTAHDSGTTWIATPLLARTFTPAPAGFAGGPYSNPFLKTSTANMRGVTSRE